MHAGCVQTCDNIAERMGGLAARALGIEPSEAVMLDDLGVNLKPARDLGMRTIKVVDETKALEELEAILGLRLRCDRSPD
jgi:putative hydrolase of the HAD superfamily